MQPDHTHRFVLSLGLAILCLAASETGSAQLVLKPATARHFHANSFVSGGASIGARFGYALAVGDFNGDGFDDLAIGVPYQPYQGDINNLAGAVIVAYGAWDGLGDDDALPVPGIILYGGIGGAPQHLERFGWSLAVGYFDDDQYADLAVGAPGYDISGNGGEGAVYTFHGGSVGLSTVADIQWNQAVLAGIAEAGEQFGTALVADDFNDDDRDDLAVGIPFDIVNGDDQGSVAVLYSNAGGLATGGNQLWNQDSPNVPGAGESGDMFGWSLTTGNINQHGNTDLVIGSPGESVGSLVEAGAVTALLGTFAGLGTSDVDSSSFLITQDWFADPNEPAEEGDRFGERVYLGEGNTWLHVGASGEDDTSGDQGLLQAIDPGYPYPAPGADNQYRYGGLPGVQLGSAGIVLGLDLYRDPVFGDLDNALIAGVPYLQVGRGGVRIAFNSVFPSDQSDGVTYFSNAFGLTAQENAHFGMSVAVGDFNGRGVAEIVIGTPLWDVHAGPLIAPDRGLITVVDDTLFADGYD